MSTTIAKANPKVGFVSLGCPKIFTLHLHFLDL